MDAHQEALQKWEPIILAVAESNQSARLWCREHNISVDQFYYWRKKLGLNQQDRKDSLPQDTDCSPGVAEIKLVFPPSRETAANPLFQPQVMIKSNDFQVYVESDFNDGILIRVLGVVKTC